MSEKYKLVEFQVGDKEGNTFYVETGTVVPEKNVATSREAGVLKDAVEKTAKSFEETMACLKPIAQGVLRSLEEINNPEEIEITFGVKVGVEGKLVVVAMSGEANFSVKLTWKK